MYMCLYIYIKPNDIRAIRVNTRRYNKFYALMQAYLGQSIEQYYTLLKFTSIQNIPFSFNATLLFVVGASWFDCIYA